LTAKRPTLILYKAARSNFLFDFKLFTVHYVQDIFLRGLYSGQDLVTPFNLFFSKTPNQSFNIFPNTDYCIQSSASAKRTWGKRKHWPEEYLPLNFLPPPLKVKSFCFVYIYSSCKSKQTLFARCYKLRQKAKYIAITEFL
jgi:hypothetical protein